LPTGFVAGSREDDSTATVAHSRLKFLWIFDEFFYWFNGIR
jgi:hypothetical protein